MLGYQGYPLSKLGDLPEKDVSAHHTTDNQNVSF